MLGRCRRAWSLPLLFEPFAGFCVGMVSVATRLFSDDQLDQLRSFPDIGEAQSVPHGSVPAARRAPSPGAAPPRTCWLPATPSACPHQPPSTRGSPGAPGPAPGGRRSCSPTIRRNPGQQRAPQPGGRRTPPPRPAAPRGRAGTAPPACRTSATTRSPASSARASRQSAHARHRAASSVRQAHQDPVIAPRRVIIPQRDARPPRITRSA